MEKINQAQIIERSIMKTYKGKIYSKFVEAIDLYKLIQDEDKIAVAVSGGKDSLLLAKLMQMYQKYGKHKFDLVFIVMDPGYQSEYFKKVTLNIHKIGIEAQYYYSNIFKAIKDMQANSPCFLCARMRRGFLYNKAQELGCNKLALGHHFNDVIETTLMNILYNGVFKTMLPKAKSQNYRDMQLIRPLYLVKEIDIIRFARYHKLLLSGCECYSYFSEQKSKRAEVKQLISDLCKGYKNVDINIFRAAENVNIEQILGYFDSEKRISFLDK